MPVNYCRHSLLLCCMKNLVLSIITLTISMNVPAQKPGAFTGTYPSTKTVTQTDAFFGTEVSDPYRWLENDLADDTKSWVQEQMKVTNAYLAKIPFRDAIKKRLTELWN